MPRVVYVGARDSVMSQILNTRSTRSACGCVTYTPPSSNRQLCAKLQTPLMTSVANSTTCKANSTLRSVPSSVATQILLPSSHMRQDLTFLEKNLHDTGKRLMDSFSHRAPFIGSAKRSTLYGRSSRDRSAASRVTSIGSVSRRPDHSRASCAFLLQLSTHAGYSSP